MDETIKERYKKSAAILAAISAGFIVLAVVIGEPARFFAAGYAALTRLFAGRPALAGWLPDFMGMVIPAGLILIMVQLVPLVLVWWERKIAAHMQSRLGPMKVGGWHGWAQTIADGIKLLMKEDIVPRGAYNWTHKIAPIVAFVPAFVCFAPVPFGKELAAVKMDTGIIFVFAVSGLSVIGILLAGWSSANKYSLLGGLRAAAQLVSYEVPRALSVVPVVMWAGTLSLTGIASAQAGRLFGFLPRWFIFYPVIGQISFLIFLISSVAETNRTPFDIPEAESELVAGFHTEYSGLKFAFFFLAEYAYVFLGSALAAVIFLGGGQPLPFLEWIPSWVWMLGKTFFIVFIFIWFRWTYPRLRIDRLMQFCWKFLVPWSLANIALAGVLFLCFA